MFCCLHWIHFMDETEDSIDIKVNYKQQKLKIIGT